jgi:hypothetical protein
MTQTVTTGPAAASARVELPARRPRWLAWITTLAVIAPAPYAISRLLWAAGIPIGIDSRMLHEDFQSPGWGSLQILLLAALCEVTALYTAVFIRDPPERVPARVPLLGGRSVRPRLAALPLLAPIVVLAGFNAWGVGLMLDGFAIPAENAGVPGWSFWGQVAIFLVWGVALTVATFAYLVVSRPR